MAITFASFLSLLSYSSLHATRPTNITYSSNRTIDYLTAAKPEAYQAHYRRISASKAASHDMKKSAIGEEQQQETKQKAQDYEGGSTQKKQEEPPSQQGNNALTFRHRSSNEPFAYGLPPDLDHDLPDDIREHKPKYPGQQPKSPPAVLHSRSEKTTMAQGVIPIGIEPSLSPLTNMDTGC
jgi:hypothetical protein